MTGAVLVPTEPRSEVGEQSFLRRGSPARWCRACPGFGWILGIACAGWIGTGDCRGEWDAEKYLVYGWGKLTLRPQLELGTTYDSNLFYAEEEVVADFFASIRPGLSVVYGTSGANLASIRYTMDASIYAERDDLNNVGHVVSHQSRFRFNRWQFIGNDTLSITRALLGGSFSYIQRRVGQVSLTDDWRADYEVSPKMVAGFRAGFNLVDYDEEDLAPNHLYDYMNYLFGGRVGYIPSEKVILFPEFTVGQSFLEPNDPQYSDSPDLTFYGLAVGAEGEFTPKLSGLVSLGYQIRKYADDTEVPDGWVADLYLRWQMRPKTAFALGYRQFIQPSQEASGTSYTAYRPTASVTQELGTQGRWSVQLTGYYEFDDYEELILAGGALQRRNDQLVGGLRANYRWQPWLVVSAGYDYLHYDDNVAAIPDYDVHRISLRFTGGY